MLLTAMTSPYFRSMGGCLECPCLDPPPAGGSRLESVKYVWFFLETDGSRVEPVREMWFLVVADDKNLVEFVEKYQQL